MVSLFWMTQPGPIGLMSTPSLSVAVLCVIVAGQKAEMPCLAFSFAVLKLAVLNTSTKIPSTPFRGRVVGEQAPVRATNCARRVYPTLSRGQQDGSGSRTCLRPGEG